MSSYISDEFRRQVALRANYLCEYCLVHEDDLFFGCQIDHIISLKHQGLTLLDNLAYACSFCNRAKGSDVGSVTQKTKQFVRFYNPRTDLWADCFQLRKAFIRPINDIGEVTANILGFNAPERIAEREILVAESRYPSVAARKRTRR